MHGWIDIQVSCDRWGTRADVHWWTGDSPGATHEWKHTIPISGDTELPEGRELAVWQSTVTRVVCRYFEDRLIEQIRTSVSDANVAEK